MPTEPEDPQEQPMPGPPAEEHDESEHTFWVPPGGSRGAPECARAAGKQRAGLR